MSDESDDFYPNPYDVGFGARTFEVKLEDLLDSPDIFPSGQYAMERFQKGWDDADRQIRERETAQAELHTLDLAGDYPKHILSARVQPGDEKGRKHGVALTQRHSCGHEGVHLAPVGSCQLPFPWLCAECAGARK